MDKEFVELMKELSEAMTYEQKKLQLKTTSLEIPDEENDICSIYKKLSEPNKKKVMDYANGLLEASNE